MIKSKVLLTIFSNKLLSNFASATKRKKSYSSNDIAYSIQDALKFVRCHSISAFDETIDISLILNVDPKKGDQIVRGSCLMPSGLGKKSILAVHTSKENHEIAKNAGADLVITAPDLENIKNGIIKFDKLIATVDCINDLKQFAKILGPKGLMPNQKVGSLIPEAKLIQSIKNSKMGEVQFRVDSGRNLHSPLGKISFEDQNILINLKSFMETVVEKKPPTVKGTFFLAGYLSSTMGPGFRIDLNTIDPRSKLYVLRNIASK